jgi:hypothetical protein
MTSACNRVHRQPLSLVSRGCFCCARSPRFLQYSQQVTIDWNAIAAKESQEADKERARGTVYRRRAAAVSSATFSRPRQDVSAAGRGMSTAGRWLSKALQQLSSLPTHTSTTPKSYETAVRGNSGSGRRARRVC